MAPFISVTELLRLHVEPYQRLVWFLCEAAEREHRLNLKALSETPGAFVRAWIQMPRGLAPTPLNHRGRGRTGESHEDRPGR
jgi:hypothetical protein